LCIVISLAVDLRPLTLPAPIITTRKIELEGFPIDDNYLLFSFHKKSAGYILLYENRFGGDIQDMGKKKKQKKITDRIELKSLLISKGQNITIHDCARYFDIPEGFVRTYWKEGRFNFHDFESWFRSPNGQTLWKSWDGKGGKPKPLSGCTVRFTQQIRALNRRRETTIYDCNISRRHNQLVVESGDRIIRLPLEMKSLTVRLPYGGEFMQAKQVFP
jgi:hypothetical protein